MKYKSRMSLFLVLSSIFSVVASSYPVAWWPFNEGIGTVVTDATGNGNNGAISGAAWTTGIEGTALSFNGTSDYVVVPDNPLLNFDAGLSFTISVWVNGSPTQIQDAGIINKGAATYEEYCIDASLGGYRFYVRSATLGAYMVVSNVFPSNKWDHVAAVYDVAKSLMKIYVNGVAKDSTMIPSAQYHSSDPLLFGNRKNIGSAVYNMPFKGTLDNIRVFNRALSPGEVKNLYSVPNGQVPMSMLIPVPSPTYNRRSLLAWHSVAQATVYSLQVDTSTSFAKPILQVPLVDTSYQTPVDFPIDTIYWQVVATINDSTKYYSELGVFIVQDARIPLLIPYQPKVTDEKKPTLKWHPVSGASTYTLQVASTGLFSNPFLIVPLTDTFYTAATNFSSGMTFWRVKSDLIDKWSSPDTFQIQSDTIPMLIRFNGTVLSTKRPFFQWHPVSNATTYRIEFVQNSLFSGAFSIPVNDTSYLPTVDLSPGVWYWHVSSDKNFQAFSPADSFDIVTVGTIKGNVAVDRVASQRIRVVASDKYIRIISAIPFANMPDIHIYSVSGKCLYHGSGIGSGANGVTIASAVFPAGSYFVDVKNGNQVFRLATLVLGSR